MPLIAVMLVAGVVLSALKAALPVLLVLAFITLVVGVITRPRQTFSFMALLLAGDLIDRHPGIVFGTIGAVFAGAVIIHAVKLSGSP